jgi:2-amino-4-hydroxy-6-hydroxymethyldihydropteridine diphosphokinase
MPEDLRQIELPSWAEVGEKRRAHIVRVTRILDEWADALRLHPDERQAWHDAGRWHDALRDASPAVLRALAEEAEMPDRVLHGPAAATRLAREGEQRTEVLAAIRHHTLGSVHFGRTGQALYMADFLEPGRAFMSKERAFLAAAVPDNFDGVFRQVVRMRIEWTLREGNLLYPETVELWNSVH